MITELQTLLLPGYWPLLSETLTILLLKKLQYWLQSHQSSYTLKIARFLTNNFEKEKKSNSGRILALPMLLILLPEPRRILV